MNKSKFWDKIAQRYEKTNIKDIESYENKLKTTQNYLNKEMNVLEIGCGTGTTAIIHAPFVNNYYATDISPVMIEIAKNKAKEKNIKNMSFEISDILNLSVEDGSKDAVLAMSVLHLIDNTYEGIGIIGKKLKTGGLFISSTICLGDKMQFLKFFIPLMRLIGYAPSKVHFLKKKELLTAIEANNFSIIHEWQPSQTKACFIIARKL